MYSYHNNIDLVQYVFGVIHFSICFPHDKRKYLIFRWLLKQTSWIYFHGVWLAYSWPSDDKFVLTLKECMHGATLIEFRDKHEILLYWYLKFLLLFLIYFISYLISRIQDLECVSILINLPKNIYFRKRSKWPKIIYCS